MSSILDTIANFSDLKTKDVSEWGVNFKIQELSAGQRSELALLFKDDGLPENYQAQLLIWACVDENLKPIFENTQDHIDLINSKNGETVLRLVTEIQELSGMGVTVEEAEKN